VISIRQSSAASLARYRRLHRIAPGEYSNDSKPGKKSDRIIENDGACVAVGLGPFQGSSAQPTAMGKKGVFILLDQCRILFLLQFAEVGKQALEIN
jgi:hypothetical protein